MREICLPSVCGEYTKGEGRGGVRGEGVSGRYQQWYERDIPSKCV